MYVQVENQNEKNIGNIRQRKAKNATGQMNMPEIPAARTKSPVFQRFIMMGNTGEDFNEKSLSDQLKTTAGMFTGKEKKPKEEDFQLLRYRDKPYTHLMEAFDFLQIPNVNGGIIQLWDVKSILDEWLGEADVSALTFKERIKYTPTGLIFGPTKTDDKNQYAAREKAKVKGEMRYYTTFYELAWALAQASGLMSNVKNTGDTKGDEINVAFYVIKNSDIIASLQKALLSVSAKVVVSDSAIEMDYKSFHKSENWEELKNKAKAEAQKDAGAADFTTLISILHDIKSFAAITNHVIMKGRSQGLKVDKFNITKENMRYNLGTVDEADPWTLFMRERGRQLWAGPSFTAQSMLHILANSGGTNKELTAEAYSIFAFWCIVYPHSATPIHTFHEVMAAAAGYGVKYDINKSVVDNARETIGFK